MIAPIFEHQQLHAGEFVDEAREAAVETCHGKILKQAQDPPRRPARFSGVWPGEDEVFVGFQPGAFQLQGLAPVKAATGGEVDIFDAGLDEA